MNVNQAFPSKYLKAEDLGEAKLVVTISHVTVESVGQNAKDTKPIVYFKGKEKGLVLNKTNANYISKLLGSAETDDWQGGQIGIYATEVDFQGDRVPAIRIFTPPKGKPKPAPAPEPSVEDDDADSIPF